MGHYLAKRALLFIPTIIGASLLIFMIMRILPGDPALVILAGPGGEGIGGVDPKELARVRHDLGLDQPLVNQYGTWLAQVARLDFGNSILSDRPVVGSIAQGFTVTLQVAVYSMAIGMLVAIPLGVWAAIHQETWVDYALRTVSTIGMAVPHFWAGVLVVLFLVRFFNWTPPLGFTSLAANPLVNFQQIVWPVLVLGLSLAALASRMVRSTMLEVLRQDYIRTARAKGLRINRIYYVHAIRNALLPVVTLLGTQFAALLGGAVVVETIFSLPGLGRQFVGSITNRDYTMVQGLLVVFSLLVITINLLVDVSYSYLNPRIRADGNG